MKKITIGLILMGIGTSFGAYSAFCPSTMTTGKFGFREGTEQDKRDLKIGFGLALVVIGILWVGLYLLIKGNE